MFALLLLAKQQDMRLREPQSHFRHGVKKNPYSATGVPTPNIHPKAHCTDLAITGDHRQIHNTLKIQHIYTGSICNYTTVSTHIKVTSGEVKAKNNNFKFSNLTAS